MKKIITLLLVITASYANAEVELVPLDMELGYWETTTEINANEMMDAVLANMPAEQRAAVAEMMKSKMEASISKQCVTEDSFKDMESKFKESLGNNEYDCDLEVIDSTSKEFNGVFVCTGGTKVTINTKVINSKHNESQINTDAAGMGQSKIKSVAKWKSSVCPAGVN